MFYHHRGVLTSHILPSQINAHGVRVYIPLKGQKNGRAWVKPITSNTVAPSIQYPHLLSYDKTVFIPIRFWAAQYVLSTPFPLAMIRAYAREAATLGYATATVRNQPLLSDDLLALPSHTASIYIKYNSADEAFNSRLALSLAIGKLTFEALPIKRQ